MCVVQLTNGRIASGSSDNSLRVWDLATGTCTQEFTDHTDAVMCVVHLADGRIVSGSGDNTLRIWDMATGKWSVTHMSISHFYMAAAAAGPFSLFCGGLAPSGDTSICDVYDARGAGKWSVGHLAKVRGPRSHEAAALSCRFIRPVAASCVCAASFLCPCHRRPSTCCRSRSRHLARDVDLLLPN